MNNTKADAHHDVGHSSINLAEDNNQEPQAKRCRYSTAKLHTINDDCLREIFKYLNIFEVGEVASTCTRLQNFAETLYPKIAKKIIIAFHERFNPLSNLIEYQKPFESFGKFIEELHVGGRYPSQPSMPYDMETLAYFEKLLSFCPNLHRLSMTHFKFGSEDHRIMKHVPHCLKFLNFRNCTGIENDWSEALKPLTKIEWISIHGRNNITANFFKHNTNLSYLAIHNGSLSTENELENIFEQNGKSIHRLELLKCTESPIFQSIGMLLVNKLPNLEALSIDDYFCDKLLHSLTKLPHLKRLKVNCRHFENVNYLMRRISACETIEDLIIIDGVFAAENDAAPPLVFNQLENFRWNMRQKKFDTSAMLMALSKAQMPKILFFSFNLHVESMNGLLALFESQKTVEWMDINFHRWNCQEQEMFLWMLWEILSRDINRPNLNMETVRLKSFDHDMEVSKIIKRI